MTIDTLSLAREFRTLLESRGDRSDRRLADMLVSAVMDSDVEREDFPFVAVNRHGYNPSIRAGFKEANECRLFAEEHNYSPETRDGRKLVEKFDSAGYAHGTTILDKLEQADRERRQ